MYKLNDISTKQNQTLTEVVFFFTFRNYAPCQFTSNSQYNVMWLQNNVKPLSLKVMNTQVSVMEVSHFNIQ